MDEPSVLNDLRNQILSKTGIRNITPADCKRISIEISKALNKNVSETTIKRLFGFAMVRHNFSKFTLSTLTEYATSHPQTFASHLELRAAESKEFNWSEVHERSATLTNATIKSIKNRSGVPYEITVKRKFSEHDFDDFYVSDYTFTSFISQPGYGRTIILSHLAEKIISRRDANYKEDTLAFITIYSLFNKENPQASFESQLKLILGIPQHENLISQADSHFKKTGRKFLIFLDGFSDVALLKDLRRHLFNGIIDFICALEDSKAIKLVMSMRSTTWVRFYDCMRQSAYLKTKWFPGNYYNLNEQSNVPPFTEKEVDMIISKIDHVDPEIVKPRLKSQLKFPFHVQLYYQLKEEDPNFNYASNITFYELISRFIQDKIYRSNYYTEKILFLKKIIQLTDNGKKKNAVSKDDLISELAAFKNAYSELLSDGILMEERSSEEFHPKEFVRFIQPQVFEYFLFIELLEQFHLKIDEGFFDQVRKTYRNGPIKLQIIQWTIRYFVRSGDFSYLKHAFSLEPNHSERTYLILFAAENLDYRMKNSTDAIAQDQVELFHNQIIRALINFDIGDPCYRESVEMLSKISVDETHTTIYNALLSILDLLKLKENHEDRIVSGKKNRLLSSSSALVLLKNISELKVCDYLNEQDKIYTELMKNIPSHVSRHEMNDSIILVFALHFGLLLNDRQKTEALFNLIKIQNPEIFKSRNPFAIFLLSIMSLWYTIYDPSKKSRQSASILNEIYDEKERYNISNYTAHIIQLNSACNSRIAGNYEQSLFDATICLQFFRKAELNICALIAFDLIIALLKEGKDATKLNEKMYERLCFIEDRKIQCKNSFIPSEMKNVKK
ncbi:NACHT domain-containing protein [Pedobacter sp. PWIIR3]